MKYSECFYSVQGEGKLTGTPSVFFRTSHCNLRCAWGKNLCDTPYTSWNPENKEITAREAEAMIKQYGCRYVVITGGEPFLWRDDPEGNDLVGLCNRLAGNHHITIETNATIFYEVSADLFSLSPKLESSVPHGIDDRWAKKHDRDRINIEVINEFIDYCDFSAGRREFQLKFVVTDGSELEEIQDLISDLNHINPDDVLLMPEGITAEEIQEKQKWLVELCMAHGFRYSDRLHTRLWGAKRGV